MREHVRTRDGARSKANETREIVADWAHRLRTASWMPRATAEPPATVQESPRRRFSHLRRVSARPHRVLVCVQHTRCHPPPPPEKPSGARGDWRRMRRTLQLRERPPAASGPLVCAACPTSCPGRNGSPCGTFSISSRKLGRNLWSVCASAPVVAAATKRGSLVSLSPAGTACPAHDGSHCDIAKD